MGLGGLGLEAHTGPRQFELDYALAAYPAISRLVDRKYRLWIVWHYWQTQEAKIGGTAGVLSTPRGSIRLW
jgi:hypothetical protein